MPGPLAVLVELVRIRKAIYDGPENLTGSWRV